MRERDGIGGRKGWKGRKERNQKEKESFFFYSIHN